jgi:hypothetical protein
MKNYILIIIRNLKQLKEELKEQKRRVKRAKEISELPFAPEINDKFTDSITIKNLKN